jgi:SAM-dependent methyltransferase
LKFRLTTLANVRRWSKIEKMAALYDTIGLNYAELRKPDQRIAAAIEAALGPADTVLNVGAGTGSYEPVNRQVTAVKPSIEMIRRRSPSAAKVIQASADHLPFCDSTFDAAMAILTVHHWSDKEAGLREVRRVTRGRIVLLTFDPSHRPWLIDYIPALAALDEAQMPAILDYARWLGPVSVCSLLVPYDCSDGFLHAYWRRPEAYLDPRIRSGISSFWAVGDIGSALQKLRHDLETGEWERRYSNLLALDMYDAGYRLVVAD